MRGRPQERWRTSTGLQRARDWLAFVVGLLGRVDEPENLRRRLHANARMLRAVDRKLKTAKGPRRRRLIRREARISSRIICLADALCVSPDPYVDHDDSKNDSILHG